MNKQPGVVLVLGNARVGSGVYVTACREKGEQKLANNFPDNVKNLLALYV